MRTNVKVVFPSWASPMVDSLLDSYASSGFILSEGSEPDGTDWFVEEYCLNGVATIEPQLDDMRIPYDTFFESEDGELTLSCARFENGEKVEVLYGLADQGVRLVSLLSHFKVHGMDADFVRHLQNMSDTFEPTEHLGAIDPSPEQRKLLAKIRASVEFSGNC